MRKLPTIALLLCASAALSQTISGSTSAQYSPETGLLTVTCTTDLDYKLRYHYAAQVS